MTAVVPTRASAVPCPICGPLAGRVHARDTRRGAPTVRGMPSPSASRCRCAAASATAPTAPGTAAPRGSPGGVAPSARRTPRLTTGVRAVGGAVGGTAGVRLVCARGMGVRADTLLARGAPHPLTGRARRSGGQWRRVGSAAGEDLRRAPGGAGPSPGRRPAARPRGRPLRDRGAAPAAAAGDSPRPRGPLGRRGPAWGPTGHRRSRSPTASTSARIGSQRCSRSWCATTWPGARRPRRSPARRRRSRAG
jgi:hypothetical protein